MRLFILAAVVAIGGLFYLAYRGHVWWQEYSVSHHCARTGMEDTYVTYTYLFDGKGNISGMIPQVNVRYQYKCDGEEYVWR